MTKVRLKVPKRSGFDKSFQNILTTKCGTLTPILVDELIPNTKVHLEDIITAKLPPLASDTYMRVNLKVEAFFVPTRLLYHGFEAWITKEPLKNVPMNKTYTALTPVLHITNTEGSYFGHGTLADYLGIRNAYLPTSSTLDVNIFPFLAYHRIYDDFYRNVQVQTKVFNDISSDVASLWYNGSETHAPLYTLPYATIGSATTSGKEKYLLSEQFADGVHLGDLRQRNFGFDYFTNAFPTATEAAQAITFNTSGSTGSFTIPALRAANSLQQFAERNQMAGYRLQDFVNANYGGNLSSGVAQRSICLGSAEIPVYSKGVYQTNNFDTTGTSLQNPFANSTGAQVGAADCKGACTLVSDFTAEEPGYLMVLASLVPHVTYANGINRMMLRYNAQYSQVDMANPLLQNVGNEEINGIELTGSQANLTQVFGYNQRFGSWKTRVDELHGLLRDGQSLDSFALQRSVTGNPTISSSFLQIPTNFMDQVSAVAAQISNYGCWIDAFHNYKVSMPLAQYSIPSLQDPAYEHGHDVTVQISGSRL